MKRLMKMLNNMRQSAVKQNAISAERLEFAQIKVKVIPHFHHFQRGST